MKICVNVTIEPNDTFRKLSKREQAQLINGMLREGGRATSIVADPITEHHISYDFSEVAKEEGFTFNEFLNRFDVQYLAELDVVEVRNNQGEIVFSVAHASQDGYPTNSLNRLSYHVYYHDLAHILPNEKEKSK